MEPTPPSRHLSRRFLSPEETLHPRQNRSWGPAELFPEGQWQTIRVQLEREGWNSSQMDLLHHQLRQGWPLAQARRNVAAMTGHCPLGARLEG